ncbi:MAG: N-acetyltransferase [Prevotellaceae bacterium]|nr:N-acetyltransferase [Prevotellaceae bacterium]
MIIIEKVESIRDLQIFIKFPHKLFKGNPYWVPPLNIAEMDSLRKDRNPSFEHCEAEYWLAYKNGELAGRIAGIINHKANEKWGKKVRFGWIDFIDDVEVAKMLLDTVAEWGKSKGMEAIHGPLGFNDMDNEGMLIEGFDKLPSIANIYNYPYYPQHLETLGFTKSEDWIQLEMKASQDIPEKVERINKIIREKYNVRTLSFKKATDILPYAHSLFKCLNAAFANLYGFSELTEKEINTLIKNYFTFINPEFVCLVVDENDEVIAFGISMPSLSRAFQKAKGGLFPFGLFYIWRALKKTEFIDLYLNGVHPDWQKRGIHSLFFVEMNKAYIRNKCRIAISNPQLENNTDAVGIWDKYDGKPYIRRRCYIKNL